MSLFEPHPLLALFIALRLFVYLELLALLALLRLIVGSGWSRVPALLTLALCAAGIATTFAPAAGANEGPLYVAAARAMAHGGGMSVPVIASGIFLASAVLPGRRWRWIDAAHLAIFAGLLCLWVATRYV